MIIVKPLSSNSTTLIAPLLFAALTLATQGCGLLQRSENATHVEQDEPKSSAETATEASEGPTAPPLTSRWKQSSPPLIQRPGNDDDDAGEEIKNLTDTAPSPQKLQSGLKTDGHAESAPNPTISAANKLFHKATTEQSDAAFLEASRLWQQFLDRYTGMPGYERARYNLSFCLFSLGRGSDAVAPLKSLIEDARDGRLANDARILLAESLLQTGKFDEALATTFDVLPDQAREASAGLKRGENAIGVDPMRQPATYAQKIRLYTIRGRIFASLKNEVAARSALDRVQTLLIHAPKDQLSIQELRFLSANYAWRQLEVTALTCQQQAPIPERLSEKEFLAYADAYYGCASPARKLYCTILAARNEQIRGQAIGTYKSLVVAPLALRDHLPPPAREIKTKEQRGHYESELKALIESTVEEHAKEFRNIESCHARDLF